VTFGHLALFSMDTIKGYSIVFMIVAQYLVFLEVLFIFFY